MRKRFISHKSHKKMKLLVIILLFITSFIFTIKILNQNLKKYFSNETYLKYIFNNSVNHFNNDDMFTDYFNNQNFLIRYALNMSDISPIFLENNDPTNLGEYMEDPNPQEVNEPLVYLYNTHQTEGYQLNRNYEYNLIPTVQLVSYVLREKLNDLNIKTIVETNDITEILRSNNWAYKYSYQASRMLIDEALKKYPSIKFIIDIHRDSSSYEKTTTTINNKQYAKILLVVGKKHTNYEANYKVAEKFNNELVKKDSSLSRGITVKDGAGVNGIYNQDVMANAILLEMGGQYNTIEEVNNTIEVITDVLYSVIYETTN